MSILLGLILAAGCAAPNGPHEPGEPPGPGVTTSAASDEEPGRPPSGSSDPARSIELAGPTRVPLLVKEGYVFAEVSIDGEPAGLFMLDTGASVDVVASGVAGRLGLERVARSRVVGVAGEDWLIWREVDSIRLGDREVVHHGRIASLDLADFSQSTRVSVAGILGFGTLSRQPFTIDYGRGLLELHDPAGYEPPTGPGVSSAPYRVRNGLPLTPLLIHGQAGGEAVADGRGWRGRWVRGGEPLVRRWVLIDTGAADALALPESLLWEFPQIAAVPQTGPGRVSGVGGSLNTTLSWVNEVEVLGRRIRHAATGFEPDRPGGGPGVARVGHGLLRDYRVTFDPTRGRVYAQTRR